MGIEWYPIMAPSEHVEFNERWIHPVHVRERKPGEGIAYKQNHFIDTKPIFDNDYYCTMMDDDMYEPGFFDVVRKQTARVIVFSLYRGDTRPSEPTGYNNMRHPATTIRKVRPEGMKPGHIDIMQYIVKGDIFKKHRFIVEHSMADGVYAQMLAEKYRNEIVFLPDWYGLFNYFQPGRYTTEKAFLKPTWKLPEIIK
jgi:hypothetical protein